MDEYLLSSLQFFSLLSFLIDHVEHHECLGSITVEVGLKACANALGRQLNSFFIIPRSRMCRYVDTQSWCHIISMKYKMRKEITTKIDDQWQMTDNDRYSHWFHTEFMNRFWCQAFAGWPETNDMDSFFCCHIFFIDTYFHLKRRLTCIKQNIGQAHG